MPVEVSDGTIDLDAGGACPDCCDVVDLVCCAAPAPRVRRRLYVEILSVTGGCSNFTAGTVYPLDYVGYVEYLTGALAHFWVSADDPAICGAEDVWVIGMRCVEFPTGEFTVEARIDVMQDGRYDTLYVFTNDHGFVGAPVVRSDQCTAGTFPAPGSYQQSATDITLTQGSLIAPSACCSAPGTVVVKVYD